MVLLCGCVEVLCCLKPGDVLAKYSLSKEVAAGYVHLITYQNQTETAEELDVSRDTVNRYKNSFAEMSAEERLLLISAFAQDQLLDEATSEKQ